MPFLNLNRLVVHLPAISRITVIRTAWLALFAVRNIALAQNVGPHDTRDQQNGMSTGVARAPVKDALSRPITAGGFVDNAPSIFFDITQAAGLHKFHHISGTLAATPQRDVAGLMDFIETNEYYGSWPREPQMT
jgi:hypothetical protein